VWLFFNIMRMQPINNKNNGTSTNDLVTTNNYYRGHKQEYSVLIAKPAFRRVM
jgi:hypothetical protein